jgi:hypothetical protein
MSTLRSAGPWVGFLLLVPMILYVLLGGVGYSMDQMDQKKAACAKAGRRHDP